MFGVVLLVALASTVGAQAPPAAAIQARQSIAVMESVLEAAVANGADNLVRQVNMVMPDVLMLNGAPRVRGFQLDGYGLFFDVDVPAMRQSLSWTLQTVANEQIMVSALLSQLQATIETLTDPAQRAEAERTIQELDRRMRPVSTDVAGPTAAAAQGLPPGVDPLVIEDPSAAYTNEVRAALVESMIVNSGALTLAPDEWLTVAARDNSSSQPFVADAADLPTVVLRIRGADLAAYRGGQLTLEEARARVDIREF